MKLLSILSIVSYTLAQNALQKQNGIDAQRLDSQKGNNLAGGQCNVEGGDFCVGDKVGKCIGGKLTVVTACGGGTLCQVLPLVNKAGTSVTCDTEAGKLARFQAAGVTSNAGNTAASNTGTDANAEAKPNQNNKAKEDAERRKNQILAQDAARQAEQNESNEDAPEEEVAEEVAVEGANATETTEAESPEITNQVNAPANGAGFKANDFQCIDDTKFRHFITVTDSVEGSCPPGMCATRSPPSKNPCVGKENAARIDKVEG